VTFQSLHGHRDDDGQEFVRWQYTPKDPRFQRPGTLFAGFENDHAAMTIEDAYRLQMEVARLREQRGEPIAGYKIGCISPTMQAQLGLDRPCSATST
jgi:hypothetical protein